MRQWKTAINSRLIDFSLMRGVECIEGHGIEWTHHLLLYTAHHESLTIKKKYKRIIERYQLISYSNVAHPYRIMFLKHDIKLRCFEKPV